LSTVTPDVVGNYQLLTRSDGPLGFGWDYNLEATTWLDAPGTIDHPGKTNYRYLQEFVIFAGDRNKVEGPVVRFGGQYFIVAVDVTSTKYKIWMSLPQSLTPEQIEGIATRRLFPTNIIRPNAPSFVSLRFLPSDWQEHSLHGAKPGHIR
jgi:hypothetical protein